MTVIDSTTVRETVLERLSRPDFSLNRLYPLNVAMMVLALAPLLAIGILFGHSEGSLKVIQLLSIPFSTFAIGAVLTAMGDLCTSHEPSLWRSYATVAKRFFPLLLIQILVLVLTCTVFALSLALALVLASAAAAISADVSPLAWALGAAAAIPFAYVFLRYMFAPLVCLLELQPATDAMRRSWRLTEGRVGRMIAVMFGYGLVWGVLHYVAVQVWERQPLHLFLMEQAMSVLLFPLIQAVVVLEYFRARSLDSEDGFTVDSLRAEMERITGYQPPAQGVDLS